MDIGWKRRTQACIVGFAGVYTLTSILLPKRALVIMTSDFVEGEGLIELLAAMSAHSSSPKHAKRVPLSVC